MKHPPFYVIKILQDTDLSHSRRIELAIDVLKLSKEELQQLDQIDDPYIDHKHLHGKTFINIDEIVGVNQ